MAQISEIVSLSFTTPKLDNPIISPPSGDQIKNTIVTITNAPSSITLGNVDIYYTIDGTDPTGPSRILYNAPFTISNDITIKAVSVKQGYRNSDTITNTYTIMIAAQPIATPSSGQITIGTTITLTSATVGANIYYTTDGNTPTELSNLYTTPIPINSATTIKAIAIHSDMFDSTVMTALYTILVVATPTVNIPAGEILVGTQLILSTITAGADIFYTIDGSQPDNTKTYYNTPITITNDMTLKAIAIKTGYYDSDILEVIYTVPVVDTPTALPSASQVLIGSTVSLSTIESGTTIYYTTNGTTPTASSSVYSTPITITGDMTIKAFAVKTGYISSSVMSEAYTVPIVIAPLASPTGSQVLIGSNVSLTTSTSGASIYYTIDGSTPDSTKTLYTTPITISTSMTIKAIAILSGYVNSSIMSESYTVQAVATPIASPTGGEILTTTTISLSTTTSAPVSIYYTIDGNIPTSSSTLYTSPISISGNTTIKAIAIKSGYIDSGIMTESYTIPIVVTPIASEPTGEIPLNTLITLSTTTASATIYYTTNGSTPTTSSNLYSSPIAITSNMDIKAIAVKSGYINSGIMSISYTIPASAILIHNQAELDDIRNNLSGHYKLVNDITLTGEWVPIGDDYTTPFTGIFDGNGYIISDLTIIHDSVGANAALFGWCEDSTIKNLGVENATIIAIHSSYIGVIVGYIKGNCLIENCYTTGTITDNGAQSIGGIVGEIASGEVVIKNCYSLVDITGLPSYAGSIVGRANWYNTNDNLIQNCYGTGIITASQYSSGITGVGYDSITIKNSVALNSTINCPGSTFAKRISTYAIAFLNNYANANMLVKGVTVSDSLENGTGITSTEWDSASWWETIANYDPVIWILEDNELPKLRVFGESSAIYKNVSGNINSLPLSTVGNLAIHIASPNNVALITASSYNPNNISNYCKVEDAETKESFMSIIEPGTMNVSNPPYITALRVVNNPLHTLSASPKFQLPQLWLNRLTEPFEYEFSGFSYPIFQATSYYIYVTGLVAYPNEDFYTSAVATIDILGDGTDIVNLDIFAIYKTVSYNQMVLYATNYFSTLGYDITTSSKLIGLKIRKQYKMNLYNTFPKQYNSSPSGQGSVECFLRGPTTRTQELNICVISAISGGFTWNSGYITTPTFIEFNNNGIKIPAFTIYSNTYPPDATYTSSTNYGGTFGRVISTAFLKTIFLDPGNATTIWTGTQTLIYENSSPPAQATYYVQTQGVNIFGVAISSTPGRYFRIHLQNGTIISPIRVTYNAQASIGGLSRWRVMFSMYSEMFEGNLNWIGSNLTNIVKVEEIRLYTNITVYSANINTLSPINFTNKL